jgi:glutathione S-transferase
MRARLAIAKAGVAVQLREVVLLNKPAELLQVSPKATVPVLIFPDGGVLEESFEIVEWAFSVRDPERWWPAEPASLRQLVADNDGDFKHNLDRYKYPERYSGADRIACRTAGEVWLMELEQHLRSSPWLAGANAGAADIVVMPFIRQFVNTDTEWFASAGYSALDQWLNYWLGSELFKSVMHKYPPWQAGDPPVEFL